MEVSHRLEVVPASEEWVNLVKSVLEEDMLICNLFNDDTITGKITTTNNNILYNTDRQTDRLALLLLLTSG